MNCKIKKGSHVVHVGDKFRVTAIKNGIDQWKVGDIVVSDVNSSNRKFNATNPRNGVSYSIEIGLNVERLGITKGDLQSRVKELLKEKEDIECRLEFMKDKDIEELDERRYRRYIILNEINKDSPAEDKEEVINELLENS